MRKLLLLTMVVASWATAQAEGMNAEFLHYPEAMKPEFKAHWSLDNRNFDVSNGAGDAAKSENLKQAAHAIVGTASFSPTETLTARAGGSYLISSESSYPTNVFNAGGTAPNLKAIDAVKNEGLGDIVVSGEWRPPLTELAQVHIGATLTHSFGSHEITLAEGSDLSGNLEEEQPVSTNGWSGGSAVVPYGAVQGQVAGFALGLRAEGTAWNSDRTYSYEKKLAENASEEEIEANKPVEQVLQGGKHIAVSLFGEKDLGPVIVGLAGTYKHVGEVSIVKQGETELEGDAVRVLYGKYSTVGGAVSGRWAATEQIAVLANISYKHRLGDDKIAYGSGITGSGESADAGVTGGNGFGVNFGTRVTF